jgi:Kef-type K+ transport system membrane component KefB
MIDLHPYLIVQPLPVSDEPGLGLDLQSLLVITLVAALTPLVVGLLNLKVVEVVLMLAAGALLGPHGLAWIRIDDAVMLLSELGLGFLFFSAGMELRPAAMGGRSGRLACGGWLASVLLALVTASALHLSSLITDVLGIAIALTSTALGTLLPMLRDRGELEGRLGSYFMAAGGMGELGPILAISVLLGATSVPIAVLSLVVFALIVLMLADLPQHLASPRMIQVLQEGQNSSAQIGLRLTLLLLVALLVIANHFGLDLVLGAFVAGFILRRYLPARQETLLAAKVDGAAFGIFVPIFFIVSGANLDTGSILADPLRTLLFLALLWVVRGSPQLLVYRGAIPDARERCRFSLLVSTALPMIVTVTTVETRAGLMQPANAAALVGAGAISVLLFPWLASLLERPRPST